MNATQIIIDCNYERGTIVGDAARGYGPQSDRVEAALEALGAVLEAEVDDSGMHTRGALSHSAITAAEREVEAAVESAR